MVYERVELLNAFKALRFNEKPTLALIGAIVVGVLPTTLFVAFMPDYPILNLLVSVFVFPTIVAMFSRFVAKVHTVGAKIPVTLMVGFTHIVLGATFHPAMPWFLLTLVPMAIVYLVGETKLTRLEIYAVDEHIIRPFTIEIPSHSKLVVLPFLYTVVFVVLCKLLLMQINLSCMSYIDEEDHSAILRKCTSFDGDINEPNSVQVHEFGSYLEPSLEAQLIKTKAESGNPEFQYLWWFILEKIYRNEMLNTLHIKIERYENMVNPWLNSAASGGSVEGMKAYLSQHIKRQLISVYQKELALKYANKLDSLGYSDAKELLEQVDNSSTRQEILSSYIAQLNKLDSLSLEELKILLHALQEGEYVYNFNGLGNAPTYSKTARNSIKVPIDKRKSLDVLKVMSEAYQNAEASFQIFNLLEEANNKDALNYLKKAAGQGHVRATGQLGQNLYCSDIQLDGLNWLNKAANLGDQKAKSQLIEIADTNQLVVCNL